MPRNGSGTYTLPPSNPVAPDTVIESTWANDTMEDLALALTNSLTRDGQTTATGNQPMGGFKHTDVTSATARNQYPSLAQIQDGLHARLTGVAGTNNLTGTLPGGATSYALGMVVTFVAPATNTDAMTLNFNGIGIRDVVNNAGIAMSPGEVVAGELMFTFYTGTEFKMIVSSEGGAADVALASMHTTGQIRPVAGSFLDITIATPTSVNIPAGTAWITLPEEVAGEGAVQVSWSAQTVTLSYVNSSFSTTLMVNNLGQIVQQPGKQTGATLRDNVVIGVVTHFAGAIVSVSTRPIIFGQDNVTDVVSFLSGALLQGALVTANGVNNLQLDITSGKIFSPGGAANTILNPNIWDLASANTFSFRTLAGQSTLGASINTAPVTNYDPSGSGTVTPIPQAADAVVHRLYYLYGTYIWVYGQYVYNSVENALSLLEIDRTRYNPSTYLTEATLIAEIVAIKSATNLGLIAQGAIVGVAALTIGLGATGTSLPEAPINGSTYGRLNAGWSAVIPAANPTMTGVATISGTAAEYRATLSPVAAGAVKMGFKSGAFDWAKIEVVNPDNKMYIRGYNPVNGTLQNTITFDFASGETILPDTLTVNGPINATANTITANQIVSTSVVKGLYGWFGNGASGVNVGDAGGIGVVFAGAQAGTPTLPIKVSGATATLEALAGEVTITSSGAMTLDSEGTFSIKLLGKTVDAINLNSTNMLLRYNQVSAASAIVITEDTLDLNYQSPAGQGAVEINNTTLILRAPTGNKCADFGTTSNKLYYSGSATLAITMSAGSVLCSALDGSSALGWDNTAVTLYNATSQARLLVSTFLAFPNIPAASPGSSGVYRDANGFLKI
jgi:hypothetical protein